MLGGTKDLRKGIVSMGGFTEGVTTREPVSPIGALGTLPRESERPPTKLRS